jgi:predicted nucleic acid-binding protein
MGLRIFDFIYMLVDTNVLIDVLENDPDWSDWSIDQLRTQSQIHKLIMNPIIYSELSLSFSKVEALNEALEKMELELLELPRAALFLAGKAFLQYRRKGGMKNNVLSDFYIGAHAATSKLPLLTRDAKRYKNYFPTVKLITPNHS